MVDEPPRGKGLRPTKDFNVNDFVIEYKGQKIYSSEEALQRTIDLIDMDKDCYLLKAQVKDGKWMWYIS